MPLLRIRRRPITPISSSICVFLRSETCKATSSTISYGVWMKHLDSRKIIRKKREKKSANLINVMCFREAGGAGRLSPLPARLDVAGAIDDRVRIPSAIKAEWSVAEESSSASSQTPGSLRRPRFEMQVGD